MSAEACSPLVPDFYSGKSVFITGGTGLVGKVIIEKLLYSCPGIEKIFVMVRTSGKRTEKQAVEMLLKSPAFTRIKSQNPKILTKIVPVGGDLCLPNLGIRAEDADNLIENVSVVFHSAATIRFNSPLREALKINVEGANQVLELARRMKKLEVFLHVSSTYAHVDKLVVEEALYPPPAELQHVYQFLDKFEHDEKKMAALMNGFPNTYTFTKALSETSLAALRGHIPLVILRPSVAMTEPVEGWVDNGQGAVALFLATAKGAMRVAPGDSTVVADMIPLDYVANLAIVAACKYAGSTSVEVIHSCSSSVNPVTWKKAVSYIMEEGEKTGFSEYSPSMCFFKEANMLTLASIFTEKLPAYLYDLLRITKRQKPRYVRGQLKIQSLRNIVRFFMIHSWQFRCERAQALLRALPPADRRLYPADPADIQWKPYLAACHRGSVANLMSKENYTIGIYRQLDD